jgi:hypothetical protein
MTAAARKWVDGETGKNLTSVLPKGLRSANFYHFSSRRLLLEIGAGKADRSFCSVLA